MREQTFEAHVSAVSTPIEERIGSMLYYLSEIYEIHASVLLQTQRFAQNFVALAEFTEKLRNVLAIRVSCSRIGSSDHGSFRTARNSRPAGLGPGSGPEGQLAAQAHGNNFMISGRASKRSIPQRSQAFNPTVAQS